METLKSVIADKIIDISSNGGDDVKVKLEKVNRFRDFVHACESLMLKYPAIEDEFIRMVKNSDFDTKVAASRVDTIIRLADKEHPEQKAESNVFKIEEEVSHTESGVNEIDIPDLVPEAEAPQYLPEDTDYEEVEPESDIDEQNEGYADFEEVNPDSTNTADLNTATNLSEEIISEKRSQKEQIRKTIQILGVIAAIVLLIFLVVFIINNWQTILYVLGGIAALALIYWILKKNKNKK